MAKAKKAAKKAAPKKAVAKTLDNTTLNTVYFVDDSSNDVTLEVNMGEEGQMGDMDITLNTDVLADKINDDFPETSIGTNKKLQKKVLRIRAIITDVLPDSNITSLIITLKGGIKEAVFTLGKEVSDNGSASYICEIKFL